MFSEFADSMKKFVTNSSAPKESRALVALKLPSVAAMADHHVGSIWRATLNIGMTSFTSNPLVSRDEA